MLLCLVSPRWALAQDAPIAPDTRLGDLRGLVDGLVSGATPEDRPFSLTPAIDVQELLTDNVYQIASPRRADVVTTFVPSLLLTGQTQRLQANISYAPNFQVYANTPHEDQIFQQFNGSALLTIIPDTLFLQLRGYGTQQAANGNYGATLSPYYGSENRANVTTLEISPYAMHRFGGWGTSQIGYVFSYTSQRYQYSYAGESLAATPFSSTPINNAVTRSSEEYANFNTGENFGRFNNIARVDLTQYNGTGNTVLNNAHQNFYTDDLGYAINRTAALLAGIGWEDIAYNGIPPIRIMDLIWSGGVRLTPNENSTITIKYRHRYGFNSVLFNASYAVTARLRVFASYSEGLTSSSEDIQNNLENSTVDQYGNTINTVTGAPSLIADQLLSLQDNLFRLKRFTATGISTYDRDVFSVSLDQEHRTLIASTTAGTGYSDQGFSASISWSHDVTPALTTTATLRYGTTRAQAIDGGTTNSEAFDVQAAYAFTPTLTGRAEYFLRNQSSYAAGSTYLQNAILVGVHKTF